MMTVHRVVLSYDIYVHMYLGLPTIVATKYTLWAPIPSPRENIVVSCVSSLTDLRVSRGVCGGPNIHYSVRMDIYGFES